MTQSVRQQLTLESAGVSLPLYHDPAAGLLLEEKGQLAPLCRLANVLATGYSFALSDHEQSIGNLKIVPEAGGQWLIADDDARVVVSKATLFECIEKLMEARMPEQPFWLLRHDALFWRPSPADRQLASRLESRAASISPNPILRCALMIEMESSGVFDEAGAQWRVVAFEELGCPVLVSYVEAARLAHDYFGSPERRKLLPEPPPARFLERHVSIEWFRHRQNLPAGATFFEWTASCEYALLRNEFGDLPKGRVLQRWGRDWYRMHWTRESGLAPALDRVEALEH